jgi:isopentenyl-diphosphate Delta-isomerase
MDVVEDGGSEALILVDEQDQGVGYLDKTACHAGRGILHRAFSLLIFNEDGDLLIQQRAPSKRLWPLYWSNSCCSHPRSTETLEIATKRRLREELGIDCPLRYLFKFQYQAQFDESGAENELCSVFIGSTGEAPRINTAEINDWRWVSPEILQTELAVQGDRAFTPWFMLEWSRIWRDHRSAVLSLVR